MILHLACTGRKGLGGLIDLAIAEKWAEVSMRSLSLRDADKVIAATALARDSGVVIQNVGDFEQTDFPRVNPFDPGACNDKPGRRSGVVALAALTGAGPGGRSGLIPAARETAFERLR